MRCRRSGLLLCAVAIGAVMVEVALPQTDARRARPSTAERRPRRAAPPREWPQSILDEFFPDARDALQGERPAAGSVVVPGPTVAGESSPTGSGGGATGFAWSQLIAADAIEDEVKRLSQQVSARVQTPVEFKGGDYQDCRQHFSMLTLLFQVVSEYDAEVRWQRDAGTIRDLLSRAAQNCKVGTDGSYKEARFRSEDLQSILRGSRVDGPPPEPDIVWSQLVDRPPLMQRMEQAFLENLTPWLSSEAQFNRNRDEILHEAQLLTVLGEVITREAYEYADDDTYLEYAEILRDSARAIAEAVPLKHYQRARAAAARVTSACSDCHDGYRS